MDVLEFPDLSSLALSGPSQRPCRCCNHVGPLLNLHQMDIQHMRFDTSDIETSKADWCNLSKPSPNHLPFGYLKKNHSRFASLTIPLVQWRESNDLTESPVLTCLKVKYLRLITTGFFGELPWVTATWVGLLLRACKAEALPSYAWQMGRGWQSGGFRDAFGFDVMTLKGRHMHKERLQWCQVFTNSVAFSSGARSKSWRVSWPDSRNGGLEQYVFGCTKWFLPANIVWVEGFSLSYPPWN